MKFNFSLALLGASCFFGGAASADDDGLYGQPIPDDAVFVRFLNGPADVFGFDFTNLVVDQSYVVVSASLLSDQPEKTYFTVVSGGEQSVVIPEPDRSSRSKVNLLLLNNTDAPISLLAGSGSMDVISEVAAGEVGMRSVNPISTDFTIVSVLTNETVGAFDVSLKRGEDITFAVLSDSVEMIPTSFGTVVSAD